MRRRKAFAGFIAFVTLGVVLLLGQGQKVNAEPSWARKYRSDCTLCHTIYPRLNRTGYEFKRLGYRFPAEVEARKGRARPSLALQASHEPVAQESDYKPAGWSEEASAGKALVQKFSCATCHQIGEAGGRIGPSLDGVGGRRSREFIQAHIFDPEQHAQQYAPEFRLGGELMPKVSASPEEIQQITAYLLTLPYKPLAGGTPHPPSGGGAMMNPAYIPASMTPAAEDGRKLYFSSGCAACHSIGGQGGSVGPALDGVGARRSPAWLMRHITNSEKHIEAQPQAHETTTSMMPPTELPPVAIASIVDFLLTLAPSNQQEESPIPRNRLQDYFGVAYLPAVEMERSPDESSNTFVSRELNVYLAGTAGPNFSFFVQPLPAVEGEGFIKHFEMIQGSFNYARAKNIYFLQVRYGQMFNFLNAGFAGTDRTIGETIPLIFEPANSFNPAELGRGVSFEYTTKGLATFKAFGVYQTPPDELEVPPSEEEAPEAQWSRTYGFAVNKVIGKTGLSGVQFQYAGGYTPIVLSDQYLPALRFQRYFFFANKTFQDKRNVERLNLIAGVAVLRDNRILAVEQPQSSHGYGYFLEANWIPVRHLGLVARFDQLRPTTLLSNNTLRAETATIVYDFTKYTRMMFEYQHRERLLPTNFYRIGWQLNF